MIVYAPFISFYTIYCYLYVLYIVIHCFLGRSLPAKHFHTSWILKYIWSASQLTTFSLFADIVLKQLQCFVVTSFLFVAPSVLAAQQMAGRGGGRPAAVRQESSDHAALGLQQRVLERAAGKSLRQVTTFTSVYTSRVTVNKTWNSSHISQHAEHAGVGIHR